MAQHRLRLNPQIVLTIFCVLLCSLIFYRGYSKLDLQTDVGNKEEFSFVNIDIRNKNNDQKVKIKIDEENYQKIIEMDTLEEIDYLKRNSDHIYNHSFGKCPKRSENFNTNYTYWKIKPDPCSDDVTHLILIKSSIYRSSLRWQLRKTWAQEILVEGIKVKRIFLIGSPDTNQKIPFIEKEIEQFNDILLGDFIDEYKSVAKKVFLGLRFVKTYCRNVSLVTIMDDDALFVPWNYFPILKTLSAKDETSYIIGIPINGAQVIRDTNNRWFVSENDFSCPEYAPYCSGTFYTVSRNAVHSIVALSRAFEPFFLEDALLGVLAQLANVQRKAVSESLFSYSCPDIIAPHSTNVIHYNHIGCHGLDLAREQKEMWREYCFKPIDSSVALNLYFAYCSSSFN